MRPFVSDPAAKRAHLPRWLILAVCIVAAVACAIPVRSDAAGKPIRMACLQNDLHHLALQVALDLGYFKDEGIAVEIAGVFRAGPEIMTAFAAGEVDAAYVGEAPATIAAVRGTARIRVLAQVNTEGSALVISNSLVPGIKKELTFAHPGNGTVQDVLLQKALARAGFDAGSVRTIVLSPPEMLTALMAGQIDGFVAWEPYPSKAVALGLGRIHSTSTEIWPNHPCCVLVVSEAFMKARPEDSLALRRAHQRATEFIRAHPDESVRLAVKFTGMDESVVKQALGRVTYTDKLSVAGEEEYVTFLGALGYIGTVAPEAFTKGFLGIQPGGDAGK